MAISARQLKNITCTTIQKRVAKSSSDRHSAVGCDGDIVSLDSHLTEISLLCDVITSWSIDALQIGVDYATRLIFSHK